MSHDKVELNCECARCGKAVYHTVRWLRENATVQCVSCNNTVPSIEILRDNTKLVRDFDNADGRNAGG